MLRISVCGCVWAKQRVSLAVSWDVAARDHLHVLVPAVLRRCSVQVYGRIPIKVCSQQRSHHQHDADNHHVNNNNASDRT